jgi:hypothetical protein
MPTDSPDAGRDSTGRTRAGNGQFLEDEATVAKHAQALALRSRGRTLAQIADELGYTDSSAAHKAIQAALARGPRATVDEMRQTMAAQLEHLQSIVAGIADNPEAEKQLDAVKTMKQLMERQAALFGMDAPAKTQLEVTAVDFSIDGIPGDQV